MKLLFSLTIVSSVLIFQVFSAQANPKPAYLDAEESVQNRVEDLLSRMTWEEKIGQMTQIELNRLTGLNQWDRGPLQQEWLERILVEHKVGSIFSGGGAAPVPNTPLAWARTTNQIQRHALENNELKIPIIYGIDAVHGHNTVLGAVIYPHNLGLGATWNRELVEKLGEATAKAVAATGIHWTFAPVGDLGLDFRWGRFYETFGEDPYLAGTLAGAAVKGLQSGEIAATAKHFLGYSRPSGGKDRADADYSLRELREIHLLPFEMMFAQQVATLMPNSGTVNGVPVHASHHLLSEILRDQLGFKGVVVSDWEDIYKLYSVYRICDSYREAIRLSINAGVDMSMVPHDAENFTKNLLSLVQDGSVSQERIDEAVRRILTLKFELGLFENPYVDEERAEQIIFDPDRSLARQAAAESLTLLKNKNGFLPLKSDLPSILVSGSNADNITAQMGGWTIQWQGAADPDELPPAVTVLRGIQNLLPSAEVNYSSGADLQKTLSLASSSELAVVVAGEGAYAEGMGDRSQPSLSPQDTDLIKALHGAGKKIVLVLIGGRPLLIGDLLDQVEALVMAYYPGTAGGTAIADLLFGNYCPGGRLPFSWPTHLGQLPLLHFRSITSNYDPLFPFGFGLSYTAFRYSELSVPKRLKDGQDLAISVQVTNIGERAGPEVVQLYLQKSRSSVLPREQKLVGFERIFLEPGQSVRLNFSVRPPQLAVVPGDILGEEPQVVERGEYRIKLGNLGATFYIE